MRNALALAAGFAIWIATGLTFAMLSLFVWGHDPDRYAAIALQSWLGSAAAFAVALQVKERIAPGYRDVPFVGTLGAIILAWAASSMLSGVDVDYKAIALAAHALAIFVAFRMARRDAPSAV